jgi:hypothetical protein
MITETIEVVQIEAVPLEISFGGVIWKKVERPDSDLEYSAVTEDGNEIRVYNYPRGGWFWGCEFKQMLKNIETQGMSKGISGVVDDRATAMLCCLDGKSILIADLTLMLNVVMPDSQYAKGFCAGQDDIKAKIAEVTA